MTQDNAADEEHLSPYELKRLAKIRRNQQVLVSLGLDKLAPPRKKSTTTTPKRSKPKQLSKKRPPAAPTRKSSRIAAIPAPSIYVDSERANGTLTLGGEDAETLVSDTSQKSSSTIAIAQTPSDEDPAPDDETLLFPLESKIYALLRDEKNAIARELETAAYHVAQNRALMAMVRNVPRTMEELLECWGWGERKVEAHGERLMGVMEPFGDKLCEQRKERMANNAVDCRSVGPVPSSPVPVVTPSKSDTADTIHDQDVIHDQDSKSDTAETDAEADNLGPLPVEPSDLRPYEQPAFDVLLAWKRNRAKELGYNDPCIICHNRTLCELIRLLPSTLPALGAVWGIGGPGTKRNDLHGLLMLEALSPFRADLLARRTGGKRAVEPDVATPPSKNALRSARKRRRTDSSWDDHAGEDLASHVWLAQKTLLQLPSCDWRTRRERCHHRNQCAACGRYVSNGKQFGYAPMSQRVLSILSSRGGYGSYEGAHAAGWRWNARPNGSSGSHTHEWWPPEEFVKEGGVKLPLGTVAVLRLMDEVL